MDTLDAVLFPLVCFVAGLTLGATFVLVIRPAKTKVLPVAKVVHNRVMPGYSRAQRRAHKRRAR